MSGLIVIGLEWTKHKLNNSAIRLQLYPSTTTKSPNVGDRNTTNLEEKKGNLRVNRSSGTSNTELYVSNGNVKNQPRKTLNDTYQHFHNVSRTYRKVLSKLIDSSNNADFEIHFYPKPLSVKNQYSSNKTTLKSNASVTVQQPKSQSIYKTPDSTESMCHKILTYITK